MLEEIFSVHKFFMRAPITKQWETQKIKWESRRSNKTGCCCKGKGVKAYWFVAWNSKATKWGNVSVFLQQQHQLLSFHITLLTIILWITYRCWLITSSESECMVWQHIETHLILVHIFKISCSMMHI